MRWLRKAGRIVSGGDEHWTLNEPRTVSGYYCYDKTRPNYPTATFTYDASGDYVTSRTFAAAAGGWSCGNIAIPRRYICLATTS